MPTSDPGVSKDHSWTSFPPSRTVATTVEAVGSGSASSTITQSSWPTSVTCRTSRAIPRTATVAVGAASGPSGTPTTRVRFAYGELIVLA